MMATLSCWLKGCRQTMRQGQKKHKDLNFLTYVEKLDEAGENNWLSVRTRLT
ncbi:hypothetical protein L579_2700 [Pantoea sp. AS-PWVM4]|nr:hypothetical protein L579_2700 [Pantoea sp. AS-PWVM4]